MSVSYNAGLFLGYPLSNKLIQEMQIKNPIKIEKLIDEEHLTMVDEYSEDWVLGIRLATTDSLKKLDISFLDLQRESYNDTLNSIVSDFIETFQCPGAFLFEPSLVLVQLCS